MPKQSELKVSFSVTGLPDSTGLRIKATKPIGLYVSAENVAAAQWYFETMIIELVIRNALLPLEPGGGLGLLNQINWPAVITNGSGDATVRTVSRAEVKKAYNVGTPVTVPPVDELDVNWWEDADGNVICIVCDQGDILDGWLLDALSEDRLRTTTN